MKVIFSIVAISMLSGCYQQAREYSLTSNEGESALAPVYGLMSPQSIMDNMTNATGLGLPNNNESVVDIRNRRIELGDADPANRIFRNAKASPGKFKTVFENYINACSDGLGITANPSGTQQTVRNRLFPNGAAADGSFDQFFLTYLGRLPTPEEKASLLALTGSVSDQVKMAAACAAVLSSMEALNGT